MTTSKSPIPSEPTKPCRVYGRFDYYLPARRNTLGHLYGYAAAAIPGLKVKMSNRATWPLFWCLSPEDQANLKQQTREWFGADLIIPNIPDPKFATQWESLEEIDHLIRQKPRGQKGVSDDGRR